MVIPAAAAVRWAELIWAVVRGDRVWMYQPAVTDFSPSSCSARVVSNVSGAEVYVGSLRVWMVGWERSRPRPAASPGVGLAPFTRQWG